MTDTKKIIEAAERHLEGTDLFVVECTSTPGNDIELTIDSDTSVGIDACAELSRAIEAELDREEEEDFSLTVMSAGIGSELRSLRQYRKLVGRPAEVLLTNGVKILAKLDDGEGHHPLLRGEAGHRGQKEKTTGDGHPHLPFLRGQMDEGVAGFQIVRN